VEEIIVDYHANRYWDDPKLADEEVVSDTFEADLKNADALLAAMNAGRKPGEKRKNAAQRLKEQREAEAAAKLAAAEGQKAPVDEPGPNSGPVAEPAEQPPSATEEWEEVVSDTFG
jgi:hypothetical protein